MEIQKPIYYFQWESVSGNKTHKDNTWHFNKKYSRFHDQIGEEVLDEDATL
jgi:hypothetical protein